MKTKRFLPWLSLFGILILSSACASVKFFNDEGLKNETGIRIYSPKPYLLVEYQTGKSEAVKTSIVYLPDLSAPQYVKVRPGIGSSALKLELSNGILTSYGLTSDTKIPDMMGEITNLLTKSTSALSDIIREKAEAEPAVPAFELFEIVITNGQTKLIRVK